MDSTTQDAPRIDDTRLDPDSGATIRIRANSGHTQKMGWTGSDITVEITGPLAPNLLGHAETIIRTETLRAHRAISAACREMNEREG
jgi:hypothetical protein